MKLIDVHTHVFPEAIAQRAADNIGAYYGIPMQGNGTVEMMKRRVPAGVDCRFVISSAALKPQNVLHGNDFLLKAAAENAEFIPFGSVHPAMGEAAALAELERIASLGVKGIKLHPDFQYLYIDGAEMLPIYKKCAELGLPVLFHVGDKNTDYSTPTRVLRVCDAIPELVVIAAHLGGYSVWDTAKDSLIGTEVYMDCSESRPFLTIEETYDLIERHGVDRVMFGSDYPVFCTDSAFELTDELPLTPEEKEQLYWGTAAKLFGVE